MDDRDETDGARPGGQVSRRDAVKTGSALALGLAGGGSLIDPVWAASDASPGVRLHPSHIRLATVSTVVEGGILPTLLHPFEAQTGRKVEVYVGEDVYIHARAGRADLVFSHFGHRDAQAFITQGLGQWPRAVLFNSIALLAPIHDPAHVAAVGDPVTAFGRIAATRTPFIVNDIPELRYLADILWDAAGRPRKSGWYLDAGVRKEAAVRHAATQGGYTLWGVTPFLAVQRKRHLPLRPVLYRDEMFHRMMVSVVLNPAHFPRSNVAGALALQDYLLEPATQAHIREYRYPGIAAPLFWPAGRNNAPSLLPRGHGRRAP